LQQLQSWYVLKGRLSGGAAHRDAHLASALAVLAVDAAHNTAVQADMLVVQNAPRPETDRLAGHELVPVFEDSLLASVNHRGALEFLKKSAQYTMN
jgi:hypothetical protein